MRKEIQSDEDRDQKEDYEEKRQENRQKKMIRKKPLPQTSAKLRGSGVVHTAELATFKIASYNKIISSIISI